METVTIEMIKAHIAATYDVAPYIEWSKEAEQELEIAAYIINMNPLDMYHCQLSAPNSSIDAKAFRYEFSHGYLRFYLNQALTS